MNRNNRFQFEEIEIHIENWMKRKKSELTSNITHCVCVFFHFYFSFSFCCICYKSLCACRKWSELKHPIGRKDQMISIFFSRKKNEVKVTPCIIIDDSRDNGSPRNDKCAMTTFSCSNFSFLSFSSLYHHRLSHHHFYFQFFFVYFSPTCWCAFECKLFRWYIFRCCVLLLLFLD